MMSSLSGLRRVNPSANSTPEHDGFNYLSATATITDTTTLYDGIDILPTLTGVVFLRWYHRRAGSTS